MAYDYIQSLANALEASGGTPYINKFGQRVVPYKPAALAPPEPTDAMGWTAAGRKNWANPDERNPIVKPMQAVGYEKSFIPQSPKPYVQPKNSFLSGALANNNAYQKYINSPEGNWRKLQDERERMWDMGY